MNGLVFTINKLGESLAAAEQRIAQLEQENAILREQIAAAEKPAEPKP